ADAALSERHDERQLGANNISLARQFVIRFGHLGWGFGPSVSALGLGTCFDHSNSPVSVYKTYTLALEAFPRVKKCFFQTLNIPAVWATLPIEPKTPPNPTHNDKPFLKTFPYLAEPW